MKIPSLTPLITLIFFIVYLVNNVINYQYLVEESECHTRRERYYIPPTEKCIKIDNETSRIMVTTELPEDSLLYVITWSSSGKCYMGGVVRKIKQFGQCFIGLNEYYIQTIPFEIPEGFKGYIRYNDGSCNEFLYVKAEVEELLPGSYNCIENTNCVYNEDVDLWEKVICQNKDINMITIQSNSSHYILDIWFYMIITTIIIIMFI